MSEPLSEPNKWNGRCKCGHLHSQHASTRSHNWSAGSCKRCECRGFDHDTTEFKEKAAALSAAEQQAVIEDDIRSAQNDYERLLEENTSHDVQTRLNMVTAYGAGMRKVLRPKNR